MNTLKLAACQARVGIQTSPIRDPDQQNKAAGSRQVMQGL